MINLTYTKDGARALNTAIKTEPAKTRIVYHEGCFSDDVNRMAIGRAAWEAAQKGLVHLFQKKLADERYLYLVEVR